MAIGEHVSALTLDERDRRHARVRERARERGIDCIVLSDSNLLYLSNGVPGERSGLLTTEQLPMIIGIHRRWLVDIEPEVLVEAQDWISDIRRKGDDPGSVVGWISELHLDKGTVGLAMGEVSHRFYGQLQKGLPGAKIVDASGILADLRSIKSPQEIALIEEANRIFDAGIDRVYNTAEPGMLGREVVQEGMRGMWDAGADVESTFDINFGAVPAQNPALAMICLDRRIQPGDMGTLTAHAEYRHYAGHSDQEISFGEPKELHRNMFEAVLEVREAVLAHLKPGATQRELIEVYDHMCKETGFRPSAHTQIHQYGIDVPESTGPAYRIPDPGGEADPANLGRAGNHTVEVGMIYSVSPTLMAPDSADTILGGTCAVVTEDGYRQLGDRTVEMLTKAG